MYELLERPYKVVAKTNEGGVSFKFYIGNTEINQDNAHAVPHLVRRCFDNVVEAEAENLINNGPMAFHFEELVKYKTPIQL